MIAIDPLLERVDEIAAVDQLLATLAAGRGGTVFVEGEPGIGKTALTALTRSRALDAGARVLSATGSELDRHLAFGGLRQLFFDVVRVAGPQSGGPAGAALAALGLVEPGPASPDPAAVAHAVQWLVSDVAQQQPALVIVDDLHWIDPASRQVIAYLCPRTADLPVGFLLASRPDPDVAIAFERALRDAQANEAHPAALSRDAVGELVAGAVATPDPAFVDACAHATGGNPFLVTELLREIAASGFSGGPDEPERIRALAPRSIQRSVLARLAALDDTAGALARTVALLPSGADLELAAAVAGLSTADATTALRALIDAHVLRELPSLDFVHPVMRAAVAERLSQADTSLGHRRAAEALRDRGARPEQIALHLLHVSPRGDAVDADTLQQAGQAALAAGVPSAAIDYLRRALAEPPPPAQAPAAMALLGRAFSAAGDPAALDALQNAYRAQPDVVARAEVAIDLAESLSGEHGRLGEAVELLHQLAGELEPGSDVYLAVLARLAVFAEYGGDADELGSHELLAWCLERIPMTLPGRTPAERACIVVRATYAASDESRRLLIPLVNHPGFIADEIPGSTTVGWAITGLRAMGELELAKRFAQDAVEHTQRWGRRGAVAQRLCQVAGMQWRLGEITEAEATMTLASEYLTGDATGLDLTRVASTRLRVALAAGRLEDAAAFSALAPDTADAHPFLVIARGELAAAEGDIDRAIELHLSMDTEPGSETNPGDDEWGRDLAKWLARVGRLDEARDILARIEDSSRRFGAQWAVACVQMSRAVVERDVDLARESTAILAGTQFRFVHAEALIDLGVMLRRRREEREAREVLRSGLDRARAMGAGLLVRRAESELHAAKARGVGRAVSGADALTPSELRVVQQAAAGATNLQAAQRLFLSVKTVEMHLANAYRKLGIASRAQLPAALAEAKR